MMRKAIPPVLGLVAAAAMLAACSSSSKSDGGGVNTPPASGGTSQQQTATDTGAPSDSDDACKPDVVVQFCETIDITGAMTVSGTAAAIPELEQGSVDSTCASWVDHQPENPDYPRFATPNDAVDGHKLQAAWKLPYKVGTYEFGAATATGDPNYGYTLESGLTVDSKSYRVTTYGTDVKSAATGSYEIKADGSGTLTFDKLLSGDGADASDTISGTISWTCVDPQS
ncbi:MAG TPA: hypothetical protein VGL39_15175 [Jatrophihabitantaceae bacterium]|jgi:hypothetical protein